MGSAGTKGVSATRSHTAVSVAILGVVIVAATVGYVALARLPGKPIFCAGVGLNGPVGSTPEATLDQVLRIQGGTASDWQHGDRRTVKKPHNVRSAAPFEQNAPYQTYDFTPRPGTARSRLHSRYNRITVSNQYGAWSASGACVG